MPCRVPQAAPPSPIGNLVCRRWDTVAHQDGRKVHLEEAPRYLLLSGLASKKEPLAALLVVASDH